jgi:hypothetical protein
MTLKFSISSIQLSLMVNITLLHYDNHTWVNSMQAK